MGRRADVDDKSILEFIAGIEDAEDPRVAWGEVKRRIEAIQQAGHEVPPALLSAERHLMNDFLAESQGR